MPYLVGVVTVMASFRDSPVPDNPFTGNLFCSLAQHARSVRLCSPRWPKEMSKLSVGLPTTVFPHKLFFSRIRKDRQRTHTLSTVAKTKEGSGRADTYSTAQRIRVQTKNKDIFLYLYPIKSTYTFSYIQYYIVLYQTKLKAGIGYCNNIYECGSSCEYVYIPFGKLPHISNYVTTEAAIIRLLCIFLLISFYYVSTMPYASFAENVTHMRNNIWRLPIHIVTVLQWNCAGVVERKL